LATSADSHSNDCCHEGGRCRRGVGGRRERSGRMGAELTTIHGALGRYSAGDANFGAWCFWVRMPSMRARSFDSRRQPDLVKPLTSGGNSSCWLLWQRPSLPLSCGPKAGRSWLRYLYGAHQHHGRSSHGVCEFPTAGVRYNSPQLRRCSWHETRQAFCAGSRRPFQDLGSPSSVHFISGAIARVDGHVAD
jgi:hypothetical protein